MRAAILFAVSVLAAGATPFNAQSAPSLSIKEVVARAGRFAEQQRDALTSVRADEHYSQELQFHDLTLVHRRQLESEVAFVQLSDSAEWLAFRNVRSVDGVDTGTDPARLEKLFREGAASNQGRRIAEENAIYNIGRLYRTFNIPTFALHILMPQNSQRFSFKKIAERQLGVDRVWEIEYDERQRPTIVRSLDGRRVPIKGRLWIVPEEGRLVRATLHASVPVTSELEFEWRHDANLNVWVPSEMRERYRRILYEKSPPRHPRYYDIVSRATYDNYRRFGVDVRIR
jgi:hypothetical protein